MTIMNVYMKRIWKLLIITFAAFAISACATYRPLDPAFHEVLSKPYTLDSGDVLRVTVFDQDNLSNTYAVDKGGHLSIPLIGAVSARGKTTKQVEKNIASGLKQGFLRDPDVSVEIDTYRPIFILGEVGTAGQYTYVPGMTVQNAIAVAGGFSARAQQADVDITRNINGEIITGRVPLSDPLLPSDTIVVRERLF